MRSRHIPREMRPSYASLCSVSNVFFFGKCDKLPAVLQPSSICQWFRLLTVCYQRFTNQPIVFCVVRPTLNSLALAKRAVSLFSSRAAALVSRVSRLRRSRARALLSGLNLKKERDCSQSTYFVVALTTSVYLTHYTPGQRCLKVDRTIHWINHYPVDKANGFRDSGLLDGDISGG